MRKQQKSSYDVRTQITTYARSLRPLLGSGAVLVMPMALAGRTAMDSQKSPESAPLVPLVLRGHIHSVTWRRLPRGSDTSVPSHERRL